EDDTITEGNGSVGIGVCTGEEIPLSTSTTSSEYPSVLVFFDAFNNFILFFSLSSCPDCFSDSLVPSLNEVLKLLLLFGWRLSFSPTSASSEYPLSIISFLD